jgi:branched-chain amino acid transport system permease protein
MLQDLINALSLGSIYLLFALGMSLVWGTIGILNFAHGAIFMFAAFVAHLIVDEMRLPMIALIVIGAAVGAVLSVAVQVLAFQPILRRAKDHRTGEMQILIGGIGVAAIPLAIAAEVTKSNPFGFSASSYASHSYSLLGFRVTNTQLVVIVVALAFGIGVSAWLRSSRSGLALRSIGVDPETASLMGVNRRVLALATMGIAGGLAGLAGVLLTYNLGAIAPESGDVLLVKAFAAVILGGVGSMAGVVVGAYVLALAETLVLTQTSGLWVDAVSFGVIFAVLLFKSEGLFGRKEVRRT